MLPKIGLVTVSLAGERIDLAEEFALSAYENLKRKKIEIFKPEKIGKTEEEILIAVKKLKEQKVDCILYLIGTWIYAPSIVTAMREVDLPSIIWGIPNSASFSLVGLNVVHGSLDEMGIKHKLIYGATDSERTLKEILSFGKAAMVRNSLNRAKFGLIGGRSIGMYPSTVDPIQIKSLFGIEIEHVDQLYLIDEAENVPDDKVYEFFLNFKTKYDTVGAPDEVMLKSIRIYKALNKIIQERSFDFVGVKCLEEIINIYTSCCLAVSLINDEGSMVACQSDINAAIAMQILYLLTAQPTIFADVNLVDTQKGTVRLVNCGSMPTTLARNPRDVEWGYQYKYMGKARGVTTVFCCRSGEVTFAALSRIQGKYVMLMARGEAFEKPKEAFKQTRDVWPHAFVKLEGDAHKFVQNIRSNHIVVGYGNVMQELAEFCDLPGITPIIID